MRKPKQEEALEKAQTQALARPSFIKEGDVRGTENIGSSDIKPPALRIAQATSPETKRSEPTKYIEGLREGEFFNSLTKEIYGEGPIQLIVVNQLGHRNVEFDPNDKNVVLDFNVPDGDPRTQFREVVENGQRKRVKPVATLFYDYLVYVVNGAKLELMTMSLKSTQLRKARDLNTILAGGKIPSFSYLFNATAVPEKRGSHSFYGWLIQPAGYVSEEQYNEASKTFDKLTGVNIAVETVDDDGEEDGGARQPGVPF